MPKIAIEKVMKRLRLFLLSLVVAIAVSAKPFTLVIDAGHGGKDPGAVGKTLKEKDINLRVALAFGKLVEQRMPDVKVVYTRKTDVFVELNERARIANRNTELDEKIRHYNGDDMS